MDDPERERETIRETERNTTIIQTDGGGSGGGGGVVALVLLLLVVLAILFFLFRGSFNSAADQVGVNVNVPAVKIDTPDINLKVPDKIEVKTDAPANQSK